MELTLKITIDATPAVISIIQALTGKVISTDAPAPVAPAAPVKKETPVKPITSSTKKVEKAAETPAEETPVEEGGEVTLEMIREEGAKKIQGGKQAAFKKLLATYDGAKELSKLDEKHYADMYEKVKAL
jgi:hypothetical protein